MSIAPTTVEPTSSGYGPSTHPLNSRGEYSCGAYPSVAWGLTLRRIDDARTLTLPGALGPEALGRMRAAYEAAKREYLRSWPDYPEDEVKFNPLSWHIRRQAGRWSLDGWADTMQQGPMSSGGPEKWPQPGP